MFAFDKNDIDDLKAMLSEMGTEHIAMIGKIANEEYYFCTCGCECPISAAAVIDENTKKKIEGKYKCPKCGNTVFVRYVNMESDSIPLRYRLEILRDDKDFFVFSIGVSGIWIDGFYGDIREEIDDDKYLCYDKNSGLIAPVDGYSPNATDYRKITFEDGAFLVLDEYGCDETCNVYDLGIGGNSFNLEDIVYDELAEVDGMADIIREITKRIPVDTDKVIEQYRKEGIIWALAYLIVMNNVRWYKDLESKMDAHPGLYIYRPEFVDFTGWYASAVKKGIKMDADNIENAWGMTVEELAGFQSLDDFFNARNIASMAEPHNLSKFEMDFVMGMPCEIFEKIIKLAEISDVPVSNAVSHVHGGVTNGFTIKQILDADFRMIESGHADIADVSRPFSAKNMRMHSLVMGGYMTKEQFLAILAKPTLDNAVKTLCPMTA